MSFLLQMGRRIFPGRDGGCVTRIAPPRQLPGLAFREPTPVPPNPARVLQLASNHLPIYQTIEEKAYKNLGREGLREVPGYQIAPATNRTVRDIASGVCGEMGDPRNTTVSQPQSMGKNRGGNLTTRERYVLLFVLVHLGWVLGHDCSLVFESHNRLLVQ
jgi:hypothetical protein